jgi:hypothetical protein
MAERKLRSRSRSLVRDFDEAGEDTELGGTKVEENEEVHGVTDRQVKGHSDSSNNVVMSATQFHEFMSTVMKESEDVKDRMRSENTKLSENIKTVADEMSIKIEVTNKNLSDNLTKQLREETESLKKQFCNKLNSETLNLTEAMNQLRKDTDLEVASLSRSVETVREKLDGRMSEHMSVVQRQFGRVSQELNTRASYFAVTEPKCHL